MRLRGCYRGLALWALAIVYSPLAAQQEDSGGELYAQARVRGEYVNDLPAGREDFDRLRLHAYLGWRWFFSPRWELGAAAKLAAGSDRNSDNRRNLDNEESNELELGELYLRYTPNADTLIEWGAAPLPLTLSGLTWDDDLRPFGASLERSWEVASFDRLFLTVGYFAPRHIDEHEARLTALQLGWRWREGAPKNGAIMLSYLHFDELDQVLADGRTRTNRTVNGRLVSDYELLDLQLEWQRPLASTSLLLAMDMVDNLGADEASQAARLRLTLGDARGPGQWELGYTIQRIQRDAVMAAFNDDDWWFPSASRGYSLRLSYGLSASTRLRLAAFVERRDDLDQHLERVLADLLWVF